MFQKIKNFFFQPKKNNIEYKEPKPIVKKDSNHWAAIERRKFEERINKVS